MAIFNMTAGSSGIKVGHNKTLIKELKLRGYSFTGEETTPVTGGGFPDWYAFNRNGIIYIITHGRDRSIWRYDPEEEIYTQETEMTHPPTGIEMLGSTHYLFMHAKHYLYDPITDTVHFACDAEYNNSQGSVQTTRIEYKFNFATNTWTELTPVPLIGVTTGCDWTINSAGTIAVGFNNINGNYSSAPTYAPWTLQGTTWAQIQNVPLTAAVRYIYNLDDELCSFNNSSSTQSVPGVYTFDGITWTQRYTPTTGVGDNVARNISVDNEGNIVALAWLEDFVGTSDTNMTYSKHAFAGVLTKEDGDQLPYMMIRGVGEHAVSGTNGFLQLRRAAIVWQGNTGYLIYSSSGYQLTKIKPVYELVES